MKDLPLITVAISFFNGGSAFVESIRSVFAQSFTNWELLLLDDGSTDDSLAMARSISDPRVRVISDGQRRGLACRLNQLADEASAPYLARMDADDLMHPDRLQAQLAHLMAHPHLDLVGTVAYSMTECGTVRGIRSSRPQSALELFKHNLIIQPTVLGKTAWFRANRYDENLWRAQDKELWVRTHDAMKLDVLQQPLLFYREASKEALIKFRRSIPGELAILKRHGRRLVGLAGMSYLCGHLAARYGAHLICRTPASRERLVARRSRPLTTADHANAIAALAIISEQSIPRRRPAVNMALAA